MLKWVYNRAKAMIRGNTIQGNHGSVYGGGLFVYQSGAVVHGNTIQDNNTLSGDGGGAFVVMIHVTPSGQRSTSAPTRRRLTRPGTPG